MVEPEQNANPATPEKAEFNSGVQSALTVRELLNQTAIARMSKRYFSNLLGFGYFDLLESIYIELDQFMGTPQQEIYAKKYQEFMERWIECTNTNLLHFDTIQYLKKYEMELRREAKALRLLMPGPKQDRW